MDKLEKQLKQVLEKNGVFDVTKSETLRKELIQMFDKKLKIVKLTTQISLLVLAAMIIYGLRSLSHNRDTIAMFTNAIVIVILAQATVLMKLWYWVLNAKYSVLKELKQLQLQIAELTNKNPPAEN